MITVTPRPYKDITRKETFSLISHKHRDKNPTCISKPNPVIHKMSNRSWPHYTGFIPRLQDPFNIRKLISVPHHINRLKDKNQVIISRDAKEEFDESQYLYMIKLLAN